MTTDRRGEDGPSLDVQEAHWTRWLLEEDRAVGGGDPFCDRVAEIAVDCIQRCPPEAGGGKRGRVVEVGCGTGWLCEILARHFVHVYATDLSAAAVDVARRKVPSGTFVAGDFLELPTPAPADLVVSCEVLAHVADQRAFLAKCRAATRPGGRFLLLTQNPVVWNKTASLEHQPDRLRYWPTVREIREHFEVVGFRIARVDTFLPMGDQGLLFWRPYAQGILRRVIGRARATWLFERLGLGRTIAIEAIAT